MLRRGAARQATGELRTEQLDIAPAQLRAALRLQQLRRCSCGGAGPERPIDGGMATEALIVHVVVSKFCDGLPLYRQSQMLARQGVTRKRGGVDRVACDLPGAVDAGEEVSGRTFAMLRLV